MSGVVKAGASGYGIRLNHRQNSDLAGCEPPKRRSPSQQAWGIGAVPAKGGSTAPWLRAMIRFPLMGT